jgi:1-deoxy-D-xylulose-5-phosphate reductoisomerase
VLIHQALEFAPKLVSVRSPNDVARVRDALPVSIGVVCGEEGVIEIATHPDADVVVSAIVGAAGLVPTMKAISAGKTIALANKESMVIAGELMSKLAAKQDVKIVPVDSEHSAIFQCLNGESVDDVAHLVLTASGGPFLTRDKNDFAIITREEALKHPNWDMGAKITIDSATMMNKGLEVIEAHYLFGMPVDKIRVVVHPQSVIHSMVEFVDGSVMAELGEPDMRVPIAYALSYPRRIATQTKSLHLPEREQLTFFEPDFEKFPCLKLAFDVAKRGQSYTAVLNAANEVAVDHFLNGKIQFINIPKLIEKTLAEHKAYDIECLDDVLQADQWARDFVIHQITI